MSQRRWDGDERGSGIGDARAFLAGASELVAAMRGLGSVAETATYVRQRHEPPTGLSFEVVTGILADGPSLPTVTR